MLAAPHQPRQPAPVQARQRPVPALHDCRAGDNKLPFGNLPRLLLAWVSTEAVRTQAASSFLGRSLSEFMRQAGHLLVPIGAGSNPAPQSDGTAVQLLTSQLIYKDEHGEAPVSSSVADRTEFWWNERKPDERVLWESKMRTGEKFFNEIIQPPRAARHEHPQGPQALALGLDLYLWLTYRTFALRAPLRLTWRQVYRQFGADPDKASDKRTVQNLPPSQGLRELKKIKLAWPELNYSTAPGVLILHPFDPGHRAAQSRSTNKLRPIPRLSAARQRPLSSGLNFLGIPRAS